MLPSASRIRLCACACTAKLTTTATVENSSFRVPVFISSFVVHRKYNSSSSHAPSLDNCSIRRRSEFKHIITQELLHRSNFSTAARHALIDYTNLETEAFVYEMNSKHLPAGSAYPPLKDGKLRFYNMRFCPYAQRPLLVAYAKGVPLDIINVDLKDKPDWLLERNPGGKVPTIETKEGSLYESLLVSDYLDEIYPNRPLYPKNAFKKTWDKVWIENISKVTGPFYRIFFAKGDDEKIKNGIKELVEGLALFENELKKRGTLFFSGSEAPGMLDYMLWPWMERIPVLKIALPTALDYEAQKTQNPALEKWRQAMKSDSAVQAVYISPEHHHLFMKSFAHDPKPNYDLLAE